jgi:hypothetical protein
MSIKNKGREGETRVIRTILDIMDVEGNVDFTRHTNTNTADGGADIVLESPEGYIDKVLEIAEPPKAESSNSDNTDEGNTQSNDITSSSTTTESSNLNNADEGNTQSNSSTSNSTTTEPSNFDNTDEGNTQSNSSTSSSTTTEPSNFDNIDERNTKSSTSTSSGTTKEENLESPPSSLNESDKPASAHQKTESSNSNSADTTEADLNSNKEKSKTEKSRIDVKNTDSKIGKDGVNKFGGDIRKNPDCKNHILLGGKGLTKGAQNELKSLQEAYSESGKKIAYISNEGLSNIENHYKALNASNSDESKKE